MSKRSPDVVERVQPKKKREGGEDGIAANRQFLDALKNQNSRIKKLEARLEKLEKQGQGQGHAGEGQPAQTVPGSWAFLKSKLFDASATALPLDHDRHLETAFGTINDEGLVLFGDRYPSWSKWYGALPYKNGHDNPSLRLGFPTSSDEFPFPHEPFWSQDVHVRNLLPQLIFNDKPELMLNSGTYVLVMKYNRLKTDECQQDAGIIVGEMEFSSTGYALAQKVDWSAFQVTFPEKTKLEQFLSQNRKGDWSYKKVTDPWRDGDIIKLSIDTNNNTVVFQKNNTPRKKFPLTKIHKYVDYLRAFAYCGGRTRDLGKDEIPNVQLTIMP